MNFTWSPLPSRAPLQRETVHASRKIQLNMGECLSSTYDQHLSVKLEFIKVKQIINTHEELSLHHLLTGTLIR